MNKEERDIRLKYAVRDLLAATATLNSLGKLYIGPNHPDRFVESSDVTSAQDRALAEVRRCGHILEVLLEETFD